MEAVKGQALDYFRTEVTLPLLKAQVKETRGKIDEYLNRVEDLKRKSESTLKLRQDLQSLLHDPALRAPYPLYPDEEVEGIIGQGAPSI